MREYIGASDFANLTDYPSSKTYVVLDAEDETKVNKIVFKTNNIDGALKTYTIEDEFPTPTGSLLITENAPGVNVKQYAYADVLVQPDLAIDYISTFSYQGLKPGNYYITDYPSTTVTTAGFFDYNIAVTFNRPIDETTVKVSDFNVGETYGISSFNYTTSNTVSMTISMIQGGPNEYINLKYKNNTIIKINTLCYPSDRNAIAYATTSNATSANNTFTTNRNNEYKPTAGTALSFYITRIYDPAFIAALDSTKFTARVDVHTADVTVTKDDKYLKLYISAPYTLKQYDEIDIAYNENTVYYKEVD